MLSYPGNRSGKSYRRPSGHGSTLSLKGWGARPRSEAAIYTLGKSPAVLSNDYQGSSDTKLDGLIKIHSRHLNLITSGQTGAR